MKRVPFRLHPVSLKNAAHMLFPAAALALAAMLALPARAADDRPIKTRAAAIYPEIAKRMRIQGVVYVEAVVDARGKVDSARTVTGNIILAPAAEDAVRKWTFEPGAGTSKVKVDVSFVLAQ